MSEQVQYKHVIPRSAKGCLAVRENGWNYRRSEKRSITFTWWCRGCKNTNEKEIFQKEPPEIELEIACAHCGLKIQREDKNSNWWCWLTDTAKKVDSDGKA